MDNDDIIERLTRVETKLDAALEAYKPHISMVEKVQMDITILKRFIAIVCGITTLLGSWAATYFGTRHP